MKTSRPDHLATTRAEFTRQAEPMSAALAFLASEVLDRIVAALGPGPHGRVLELACGPGLLCAALAPVSSRVMGLDATPEMTRVARRKLTEAGHANVELQVGLAETLPFRDGAFDAAVTRLSFHHLLEPAAAAAELRRVLRPGGRAVVADLVAAEERDEPELRNALERLRDPSHVRVLEHAELLGALEGAGLELEHTETWEQPRRFEEWAAIVADPARTGPLRTVMMALARRGEGAGIDLREEDGELRFTYRWAIAVARAAA